MTHKTAETLSLFAAVAGLCFLLSAGEVWGDGDADILFRANFDGTLGARRGKVPVRPAGVRGQVVFEEGIRGKALVTGEAGALLSYPTKGNVAAQRGTIAMWVKPVDWTPADEGFHIFFVASSPTGWVQLYKHFAPDASLLMLVGKGGDTPHEDYWDASKDSGDVLAQGKWVHLVGTWDQGRVALYADGVELAAIRGKGEPADLGETFQVGDGSWGNPRQASKTLIDEFTIYRRPLSAGEVKALYHTYVPEDAGLSPQRLTVVKTRKPPTVDGALTDTEWTEPEWGNAAAFTGFIDASTRQFASRQARAWFTWDDDRLYFAFASDIEPGSPPLANIRKRDGAVWGDDAIEFFIAPPGEAGKKTPVYFQFIGNAAGVITDSKSNDMTWNGPWNYAAGVFGGYWAAEGSIRWSDLGLAPPKDGEVWRANFARDWQNPQAWTVWGHAQNFHDVNSFAYLTFRDAGVVAQVEDLGAFTSGNVAFDVTLKSVNLTEPSTVIGRLSFGSDVTEGAVTVPPDGEAALEFRTTIEDAGADTMKLAVLSETNGTVLWDGSFPFERTNPIVAELEPIPSNDVIEAKINIAGMAPMPQSPRAKLIFIDTRTSKESAVFACDPFDERGRSLTRLPLDGIPQGSYDVRIIVFDGETPAGETALAFDRREEPWRGNTIGITDKVLPGWTPIEVGDRTLSCWGRKVTFDGTLFPSGIVTRDEELLASPIRLDARADGGNVEWTNASFEVVTATPARVDFVTATGSRRLRVVNDAYLEYDGMFLFETTITPVGGKVRLDSLSLVIPVKNERALFRHVRGEWPDLGGKVSTGSGTVWKTPFKQYMWVGDHDRGLTWFTEDKDNWNISDSTRTLELFREDDVVQWRVHVVDAPMELEAPLTITVGLQPTPVKPRRKGWRMFNDALEVGHDPAIKWTTPATTKHFGYPEAPDPDYIRLLTDDAHSRGVAMIPYMHAVRLGEMSPEWRFYGRDWATPGVVDASSNDVLKFRGSHMGVCPSVKEVRDWYAWKNEQYLTSTGYDGLYYDHAWPTRCSHARHDHAPGAIPLMGYREQYRRLYTLVKERDPEGFIAAHISGGLFSPMLSWTDITIPGEELATLMATKGTDDLFDVISFDYYQAWCTARQFGQAPLYLPPVMARAKYHNCFMLLTDSVSSWQSDWVLLQLYGDLGMGADDVEFLPFWDNGDLIQARADPAPKKLDNAAYPDPLVSAYRRARKFVLFAVCNMTKADRNVTVSFDADGLGFNRSQCTLSDAYTQYPRLAAAGSFSVDVKGHSYRLVLLGPRRPGETVLDDRGGTDVPTPIPPLEDRDSYWRGEARAVTGTGSLPGKGEVLLFAGDAERDQDAPLPQESRAAQTFTLAGPTKIQSLMVQIMESGGPRQLPCDLRIHKLAADGTPSHQLADPRAWTCTLSRPGTLVTGNSYLCRFFFKESFVLPAGRYAFVLSKRPGIPENRHHYAFTLWEGERLPAETALSWQRTTGAWERAGGVISFSVFGFER